MKRRLLFDGSTTLLVKVCCISSIDEAETAIEAGADAIGLVSAMPSGPGIIADDTIASIMAQVRGRAVTVLLTSRSTASAIEAQLERIRPDILQVVDSTTTGELGTVRTRHPEMIVMPVVHVRDAQSLAQAVRLASSADALLLDSGNPSAHVKELGGTGRTHDWQVSRAICAAVSLPVFLAGGLRPDNVADAIRTVRPSGVDVCSGVRCNGKLDRVLLAAFIAAARESTNGRAELRLIDTDTIP